MAETLETLLNDIQMNYTTNLIPLLDNISAEKIVEQIGPGNYDKLLNTALDNGHWDMVKLLLSRSDLIQESMDDIANRFKGSDEHKEELERFAKAIHRSNARTYKGKWGYWQEDLAWAKENGYRDLMNKIQRRMDFENDRRLEGEGKKPEGTSENHWYLNKKAWIVDGAGQMEYDLYDQKNAQTIIDELAKANIKAELSRHEIKEGEYTDYRLYVSAENAKDLNVLLKQKRQEKQNEGENMSILRDWASKSFERDWDAGLDENGNFTYLITYDDFKELDKFPSAEELSPDDQKLIGDRYDGYLQYKLEELSGYLANHDRSEPGWEEAWGSLKSLADRGYPGAAISVALTSAHHATANGDEEMAGFADEYFQRAIESPYSSQPMKDYAQTRQSWYNKSRAEQAGNIEDNIIAEEAETQQNDEAEQLEDVLTPEQRAVVDKYYNHGSYYNLTPEEQQIWRGLGPMIENAGSAEDVLKILGAVYSENEQGILTVHHSLPLGHLDLKKLPDLSKVQVLGSFSCRDNQIQSLEGAPGFVKDEFFADYNPNLTSLKGLMIANPNNLITTHCDKLNRYKEMHALMSQQNAKPVQSDETIIREGEENMVKTKIVARNVPDLVTLGKKAQQLVGADAKEINSALWEEWKDYKKAASLSNEELESADKKAQFLHKIYGAYSKGEFDSLRDVIQTPQEATWANAFCKKIRNIMQSHDSSEGGDHDWIFDKNFPPKVKKEFEVPDVPPKPKVTPKKKEEKTTVENNIRTGGNKNTNRATGGNATATGGNATVNINLGPDKFQRIPDDVLKGLGPKQDISGDNNNAIQGDHNRIDDHSVHIGSIHIGGAQPSRGGTKPGPGPDPIPSDDVSLGSEEAAESFIDPGVRQNWVHHQFPWYRDNGEFWGQSFRHKYYPYYISDNAFNSDEDRIRFFAELDKEGIKIEGQGLGKKEALFAEEEIEGDAGNQITAGERYYVVKDRDSIKKLEKYFEKREAMKDRDDLSTEVTDSKENTNGAGNLHGEDVSLGNSDENTGDENAKTPTGKMPLWMGTGMTPHFDQKAGESLDDKVEDEPGALREGMATAGRGLKAAGKAIWEELGDENKAFNEALAQFSSALKTTTDGSDLGFAILAFPFDFLDTYLAIKAGKEPKKVETLGDKAPDDKKRQLDAIKKFMEKMIENDKGLFDQLAENGVIGPVVKGLSPRDRAENAKAVLTQNPELWGRFNNCFVQTAQQNPELFRGMYPADYKGKMTPDMLLKRMMGLSDDEQIVLPQQQLNPGNVPQDQAATQQPQEMLSYIQQLVQEVRGLRETVESLRTELAQTKQELAQTKLAVDQLTKENTQLRAQNEALQAQLQGKTITGQQPTQQTPPVIEPGNANGGSIPPTTQTAQPKMEEREIPDLTKIGTLSRYSERSEFDHIMSQAFEDAIGLTSADLAGATPEKLANTPGAQLMNEIRKARQNNDFSHLNDFIKTDVDAKVANNFASSLEESDEGDSFALPRIKKEVILTGKANDPKGPTPTTGRDGTDNVPPTGSAKPAEGLVKDPSVTPGQQMTPEQVEQLIRKVLKEIVDNGYSVDADIAVSAVADANLRGTTAKNKEKAKELKQKAADLKQKKDQLDGIQKALAKDKGKEITDNFTLNDKGDVVRKDGSNVTVDQIKETLGSRDRRITKKNITAILQAGNEKGEEATSANPDYKERKLVDKDPLNESELTYLEDHPALRNYKMPKSSKAKNFVNIMTGERISPEDLIKRTTNHQEGYDRREPSQEYSTPEKIVGLMRKLDRNPNLAKTYRDGNTARLPRPENQADNSKTLAAKMSASKTGKSL